VSEAIQQRDLLGWNLAFSAGACAASLALLSPRFAGSVALGAALETVNLRALWAFSEQVLLGRGGGGTTLVSFTLRFGILGAALWLALAAGAHPIGLLVGLSSIVPAVIFAAWRARPPVVAPALPPPPPDDASWDAWNPWLARERDPSDDEDAA